MLPIKYRRTRQPPGTSAAAPDSLARGLEFAWTGSTTRDFRGRAVTNTGAVRTVSSRFGRVFLNARGQYLDTVQNYTRTSTNAPITYAAWVNADNTGTALDTLICVGAQAVNYQAFLVYLNVVNSADVYVGTFGNDVRTSSGNKFVSGQWFSLVVSFDGTGNFSAASTVKVYVDRVSLTLTQEGSVNALSLATSTVRVMNDKSGSSRALRGKLGPSGIWSRPWTQRDVDAWHANPWQIFERRRIWVPVSVAGGGASVSLTGQAATFTQGTAVAAATQALAGATGTAVAGTLLAAATQPLAGAALAFAHGSLYSTLAQPLTGGSVAFATGTLTASGGSDVAVNLVGEAFSAGQGVLTPALSQALAGSAAAFAQGTLNSGLALSGASFAFASGAMTAGLAVPLTGASSTFATGTLSSGAASTRLAITAVYFWQRTA